MISSTRDQATELDKKVAAIQTEFDKKLHGVISKFEARGRLEQAMLFTQLSRMELKVGEAGRSAAYAARALECLESEEGQNIGPWRKELVELGSQAFSKGRWSWRSPIGKSGHQSEIRKVAVSPTGETLATAGGDGKVRLWKSGSGALLRSFDCGAPVVDITFTSKGERLFAVNEQGELSRWDCGTGKNLGKSPLSDGLRSAISLSPKGNLVVKGGEDGSLRLWNTSEITNSKLMSHASSVTCVGFDAAGQNFITGDASGEIRYWSAEGKGKLIKRFEKAHRASFSALAWSRDGSWLATGAKDGSLALWLVSDGMLVQKSMAQFQTGEVTAVSLDVRGSEIRIATAGLAGEVRVWKHESGSRELIVALQGHTSRVRSIVFFPSGQSLLTGGVDRAARLWSIHGKESSDMIPRFASADFLASPTKYVGQIVGLEVKGVRLQSSD
jgi:WD40 repeat protein